MPIIQHIKHTSLYSIVQKLRHNKQKKRANKLIETYVKNNHTKKLHIGCGGNEFDGWLNTDIFPYNNNIAFLDAGKIFPINTATFDCVYSEHVFEHLTFEQQQNYLTEAYRILKPNGVLRIATPNFNFLMQLANVSPSALQEKYVSWNFNHFLPNINKAVVENYDAKLVYVVNNYFKDWGHQLIHNPNSIQALLTAAGFRHIQPKAVGESNVTFLKNIELHGNQITDQFNLLETMVFEAVK